MVEARQILTQMDRAAAAAQWASGSPPTIQVGITDASNDSMPLILHNVRERYPELEIHEIELGVPQQLKLILNGRLDVGLGRAYRPPSEVAARLVRLDQLGVLIPENHRLRAGRCRSREQAIPRVPLASLVRRRVGVQLLGGLLISTIAAITVAIAYKLRSPIDSSSIAANQEVGSVT